MTPSLSWGDLLAVVPPATNLRDRRPNHYATAARKVRQKRLCSSPAFAPPELDSIAWAGFQEFARQWWLIGRREKYEPGTGHHKLWFNVGGSAGHSSLWALNIDEGTPKDPGGRRWQVQLNTATEARQTAQEQQEQAKQQARDSKHAAKVLAAREGITAAFRKTNENTRSQIQELSGTKGAAFDQAWGDLMREGKITATEITRSNGQKYAGYRFEFGGKE